MLSLEKLFAIGNVTHSFEILGLNFKMRTLDSKSMFEACEFAGGSSALARNMDLERRILSRAIIAVNNEEVFKNLNAPTKEEINSMYDELGKLNQVIINQLYTAYAELEEKVVAELSEDIKK